MSGISEQLQRAAASGSLILVPDSPLRWAVLGQFSKQRIAAGQLAVAEPRVRELGVWLNECWEQLLAAGDEQAVSQRLLSATEELSVWESIIAADQAGGTELLNRSALAEQAMRADRLLEKWLGEEQRKDLDERQTGDEPEFTRFLHWRRQFRQRCRDRHWLRGVDRLSILLKAFTSKQLRREAEMLLYGIDEIAPLEQRLFEVAAEKFGIVDLQTSPGTWQQCVTEHTVEELQAATHWAREQAQRHPGASIAIVVPELQKRYQLVDRMMREAFAPGSLLPESGTAGDRFLISAPQPLLKQPLIADALKLLQWLTSGLPPAELKALLYSPFWSAPSVATVGQLSGQLSDWQGERVDTRQFIEIAESLQLQEMADFLKQLPTLPATADARQWVSIFEACLLHLGWPGRRSPGSREYQQQERWQKVLDSYASGVEVYGRMRPEMALTVLRKLLNRTAFQPASERFQVQVLNVHEAVHQNFDYLWVSCMDEKSWPPVREPNPLLPFYLQQQYQMPHTDSERELEQYQRETRALLAGSSEVIVSFAQYDEYGARQHLSLLVKDSGGAESGELDSSRIEKPFADWCRRIAASDVGYRQAVTTGLATAVAGARHRGGSDILKEQGRCPFRAFLRYRLGAEEVYDDSGTGLSALTRGTLTHRIMYFLWQQLGRSEELAPLGKNPQALNLIIAKAVEKGLEQARARWSSQGGRQVERLWSLERERLIELVGAELQGEYERWVARGEHFAVEALEEASELLLGSLQLYLKIDRADRLDSRELRLLDYKTGSSAHSFASWRTERPQDPQLLLYALALQEKGKLAQLGWIAPEQERAFIIADSPPKGSEEDDWEEQLALWQQRLTALADEYTSGVTDTSLRRDGDKACKAGNRSCQFRAVCRIATARATDPGGADNKTDEPR